MEQKRYNLIRNIVELDSIRERLETLRPDEEGGLDACDLQQITAHVQRCLEKMKVTGRLLYPDE